MATRPKAEDLLFAREVAAMLGLKYPNNVHGLRRRHSDFPEPIKADRRCLVWYRPDITRWMKSRGRDATE